MSTVTGPPQPDAETAAEPRRRPWYRKKRYLLPILFFAWMTAIGAIFGEDSSPPRASDAGATAEQSPAAQQRCEPADPFVMSAIAEGLHSPEQTRLSRGQAVRSRDFESLWFLATVVAGPQVDDGTVVLWAVDRNDGDVHTVFAVDEAADELSMWGDVAEPSDPPLPSDDGAADALACSRQAEGPRGILPAVSPRAGR